ncbi:hypothetical protein TWF694_003185 [Orbilia ellipsospora]|uniref:Mid2 domain-containing protein n=1 Tax=Orbilia ellipsospora TaxID=2528407 RepID=A0AAV9X214_9PEZI
MWNSSGCGDDGCQFANGTAVFGHGSYCGEESYACDVQASPKGGCCPLGQVCIAPSGCQDYVPPASTTSAESTTAGRTEVQITTRAPNTTSQPNQAANTGTSGADPATSSIPSTQSTVASNSRGISEGAVIAIAIGCILVGLLISGFLLFFIFKKWGPWKRPQVKEVLENSTSVVKAPQELQGSSYEDRTYAASGHYGNNGWDVNSVGQGSETSWDSSKYSTETQKSWYELSATSRVPQGQFYNRQELQAHDDGQDSYRYNGPGLNRMI